MNNELNEKNVKYVINPKCIYTAYEKKQME